MWTQIHEKEKVKEPLSHWKPSEAQREGRAGGRQSKIWQAMCLPPAVGLFSIEQMVLLHNNKVITENIILISHNYDNSLNQFDW